MSQEKMDEESVEESASNASAKRPAPSPIKKEPSSEIAKTPSIKEEFAKNNYPSREEYSIFRNNFPITSEEQKDFVEDQLENDPEFYSAVVSVKSAVNIL